MMDLVIFILATIGMTGIVNNSDIFGWLKNWIVGKAEQKKLKLNWLLEALDCSQCMGFWSGFIMGWIMIDSSIFVMFACGCAGSMLAPLYEAIYHYIGSITCYPIGASNEETTT